MWERLATEDDLARQRCGLRYGPGTARWPFSECGRRLWEHEIVEAVAPLDPIAELAKAAA
jgi:hypothetical protein